MSSYEGRMASSDFTQRFLSAKPESRMVNHAPSLCLVHKQVTAAVRSKPSFSLALTNLPLPAPALPKLRDPSRSDVEPLGSHLGRMFLRQESRHGAIAVRQ